MPTKERGPKKKLWWSCLSSTENASSIGQNSTTLSELRILWLLHGGRRFEILGYCSFTDVASRPSKKPFQYYPVRFRNGNESYILLPAFIKSLKSVCSNAGSYDNHVVIKTELQEGLKANNLIYKDENDVEFNWLRDIKWTEVAPGVFENYIMTGRTYITGLCKLEEGIAKKCKINYGEDMVRHGLFVFEINSFQWIEWFALLC